MSNDRDYELDEDVGRATIVYDDPEEGVTEKTVPNEHIAYFQDHWMVKVEEDEQGRDRVRRIPGFKVHYVERTVDEFAAEVRDLRGEVESIASDIGDRLPIGGANSGEGGDGRDDDPDDGSVQIDVTDGDPDDPDDRR